MNARDAERQSAISELRSLLPPGSTVYTILEHVSRSGMLRYIRVVIPQVDEHGRVYHLHPNHLVSLAIRAPRAPHGYDGIKMTGCGMDMGFDLVYQLSYVLYPSGFGCIGEHCPSNDHTNGDRDYTIHGHGLTPHIREVRVGSDHWHHDGGYALKHSWL